MFWYEKLKANHLLDGDILETLFGDFIVRNGIIRQKELYSKQQEQTKDAFGFKWSKRDTYESTAVKENSKNWLIERYLGGDIERLCSLIPEGTRILDAGCGSGFSALLLFGKHLNRAHYLGVDISTAVDVAQERFSEAGIKGEFIQANLTQIPIMEPCFDIVFSEGVLHHTDSTEKSFRHLCQLLIPGGRMMMYVYRRKGIIREFSDDYIRDYLQPMDDNEAWEALKPLTKLGKALGDLNIEIDIPEDIPYLGIKSGKMDLQRFFYWNICKSYYRPDWTLEEMNHINFDWFRPMNCHRHNEAEIKKWCIDAEMEIEQMNIQEAGITLVARKEKS